MNRLNATLIIIVLFYSACKSKAENQKEQFETIIKKYIDDYSFITNTSYKIYDFNIVKINNVTRKTVDSELIVKAHDKYKYYESVAYSYLDEFGINSKQARLYQSIGGDPTLMDIAADDAKKSEKKARSYMDSALFFLGLDTTIRQRIESYKNPEQVYQVKTYFKATFKKGRDSTNILDTVRYYIDRNNQIIDLTDIK